MNYVNFIDAAAINSFFCQEITAGPKAGFRT